MTPRPRSTRRTPLPPTSEESDSHHLCLSRHRLDGGFSSLFQADCLASRLAARISSIRGRKAAAAGISPMRTWKNSSTELTSASFSLPGPEYGILIHEAESCKNRHMRRRESRAPGCFEMSGFWTTAIIQNPDISKRPGMPS